MSRSAISKELKEVVAKYRQFLVDHLEDEVESRKGSTEKSGRSSWEISQDYQTAYTRALGIVRTLMPERYEEFQACYKPDSKRKSLDVLNYTIQDYFLGFSASRNGHSLFSPSSVYFERVRQQQEILQALLDTVAGRISNAEAVLQAAMFDRELDVARELHSKGHLRAAGAVAGVVLETHLASVAVNRSISIRKKHPTIGDLNDPLKDGGAYDVPTWRLVQRLADIRNLSVHKKEREPTSDEVSDLVVGVRKVVAEVF